MRIGSTVALFCSVSLLLLGSACDRQEPMVPPSPDPPIAGSVTIVADTNGKESAGETKETINCAEERDFCRILKEGDSALAPVAAEQACTMVYGGPETATITGEVEGEKINLMFSRNNGCEIARFDQLVEELSMLNRPVDLPISKGGAV